MFGSNSLRPVSPIAELLALAQLAPGGGATPPLPANLAAGSQTSPTPAPVGMFGAGSRQTHAAMNANPNRAPDGLPYARSAGDGPPPPPMGEFGGDVPSVLGQGALQPDQFALGRDLANLSHVDKIKAHKGPDWARIGLALAAGANGFLAAQGNPAGQIGLRGIWDMIERQRQEKARLAELQAKRYEPREVGGSLIQLQQDGSYSTLYDAPNQPQPFEAYAAAQGFQPGTPEYINAVRDYRLGAWSDPAVEAKRELEGVRYGFRDALQDDRLASSERNTDVRVAATRRGQDIRSTDSRRGQDVRSTDTRRGQDMNDQRGRRGQDMTDRRTRESASFNGKGGSDLIGPVYVRGQVRMQFSKSQNKYVRVP